jgi:hypothetical protein
VTYFEYLEKELKSKNFNRDCQYRDNLKNVCTHSVQNLVFSFEENTVLCGCRNCRFKFRGKRRLRVCGNVVMRKEQTA